jgi:hypothetical protein
MTKAEFKQAFEIAKSNKDLTNVDDSTVYGCGLPDFKPVYVTLEVVAKLIRWQCQYIFGDGWDMNELDNIAHIAKKKFLIIG